MKRENAQRLFDLHSSQLDQEVDEAAIKAAELGATRGLVDQSQRSGISSRVHREPRTKELIAVSQLSRVGSSLEIFAFGVFAAAVGMGSYLTHLFDARTALH